MDLKYNYWFFKSALNDEICDKILDIGKTRLQEFREKGISVDATTFGKSDKKSVLKQNSSAQSLADKLVSDIQNNENDNSYYVRDSNVTWLTDQWLYDIAWEYLEKANRSAGWNFQYDWSENFQFTEYKPEGFYGWHTDGPSDHFGKYKRAIPGVIEDVPGVHHVYNESMFGKIRKLSMTINITHPEEYDGGLLKFDFGPHRKERYHECEEIKPRGSIIVFPSFLHHQVTPVTKGTRYSLVLWTLGKPFV
jgi:PKHD-type hydroxylase